jgi:hypothetical protein
MGLRRDDVHERVEMVTCELQNEPSNGGEAEGWSFA